MAVVIHEVGITVKGSVVRKFDGTTTTLLVSADQALEIREDLDTVIDLLGAEPDEQAPVSEIKKP